MRLVADIVEDARINNEFTNLRDFFPAYRLNPDVDERSRIDSVSHFTVLRSPRHLRQQIRIAKCWITIANNGEPITCGKNLAQQLRAKQKLSTEGHERSAC